MKVGDICVVTDKHPRGAPHLVTRMTIGRIAAEPKHHVFELNGYQYLWNQLRPATFEEKQAFLVSESMLS